MVSKQTKTVKSVPPASQEAVKKKIKKKDVQDNKVHRKSQRGQIKNAQSKKNPKLEGPVKHSIQVRVTRPKPYPYP